MLGDSQDRERSRVLQLPPYRNRERASRSGVHTFSDAALRGARRFFTIAPPCCAKTPPKSDDTISGGSPQSPRGCASGNSAHRRPTMSDLELGQPLGHALAMDPLPPPFAFFCLLFSGWVNRPQQAVIEYLIARGASDVIARSDFSRRSRDMAPDRVGPIRGPIFARCSYKQGAAS
jgi:hypothetical protein